MLAPFFVSGSTLNVQSRESSGSLAIFAAIRRASSWLSNLLASNFQQHRIAITGSGGPIYVAQAQFSVADTGANEQ